MTLSREALPCILLAIQNPRSKEVWTVYDSLEELSELARTAGYTALQKIVQTRPSPHPSYYIGEGKLQEVKETLIHLKVKLLIIDDELTPNQSKSLESALNVKVIDRTGLILDIFARNARTAEAQLQVEFAQLEYLYPRLTRLWTHLSRLGGGIGTRGPGEKQLEVDKRQIKTRIETVKNKLEKIKSHRDVVRSRRENVPMLSAAIVGYTNAGKSTLLNALTLANVLSENKLFATLDPTTKRLTLPQNETILITDTVGFIQKLPHQLVSSFRATLEEVLAADFLFHVVDVSHPKHQVFIETAIALLKELHADQIPVLYIFNKIDQVEDLTDIQDTLKKFTPNVCVSALEKLNFESLYSSIHRLLLPFLERVQFVIPYSEMSLVQILHEQAQIHNEMYEQEGIVMEVTVQKVLSDKLKSILSSMQKSQ